jgi:hypothetical protein
MNLLWSGSVAGLCGLLSKGLLLEARVTPARAFLTLGVIGVVIYTFEWSVIAPIPRRAAVRIGMISGGILGGCSALLYIDAPTPFDAIAMFSIGVIAGYLAAVAYVMPRDTYRVNGIPEP